MRQGISVLATALCVGVAASGLVMYSPQQAPGLPRDALPDTQRAAQASLQRIALEDARVAEAWWTHRYMDAQKASWSYLYLQQR